MSRSENARSKAAEAKIKNSKSRPSATVERAIHRVVAFRNRPGFEPARERVAA